ncbi:MAG: DUF1992 domain-containing protein [Bilophila sp.]
MDIIGIIAEQRIREAQSQGTFDNLPGQGQPLQLEDDSQVPEDLRLAYKMLRNAGFAPPELEDRKEAQSIMEFLKHCDDEQEKVRQMRKLDVILARISRSRGHSVSLSDTNPYYTQVIDKISVREKG